jgi:hypothetical protein
MDLTSDLLCKHLNTSLLPYPQKVKHTNDTGMVESMLLAGAVSHSGVE